MDITGNCDCDDSYYSLVNSSSPLLSGHQEQAFDPTSNIDVNKPIIFNKNDSNQNNIDNNNNNINNIDNIDNIDNINNNINNKNVLEVKNILSNNINNMNNNSMNNPMLNNNVMSNNNPMSHNNPMVNNNPMINNNVNYDQGSLRMTNNSNNSNNQIIPNNISNGNMIVTPNNRLVKNNVNSDSYYYNILKNYNYVLIIVIALAWNDVAKFYINKGIKYNNLTPMYYVYYGLGVSVLLYCSSKYVNSL